MASASSWVIVSWRQAPQVGYVRPVQVGTPPRTSIYRISYSAPPRTLPGHRAHRRPRTSRRRSCPRIADSAPAALPTQHRRHQYTTGRGTEQAAVLTLDQCLDSSARLGCLVDQINQSMLPSNIALSGAQSVGKQLLVRLCSKICIPGNRRVAPFGVPKSPGRCCWWIHRSASAWQERHPPTPSRPTRVGHISPSCGPAPPTPSTPESDPALVHHHCRHPTAVKH